MKIVFVKRSIPFFALVLFVLWIAGCATVRPEGVRLCHGPSCEPLLEERAAKEALLLKMSRFLKQNLNRDIQLYEPDSADSVRPDSAPDSFGKGISYYVQGGPMPGKAVIKSLKFTDIIYMDRENLEIKFKVKPTASWIAMPVFMAETEGTIKIRSAKEVQYLSTYIGSWTLAASAFTHEWLIDYVDFRKRVLGGNFSIAGGGILNAGGGKGYQLASAGPAWSESDDPVPAQAGKTDRQDRDTLKPSLVYQMRFTESSGDGVIDGGEEVSLKVEVENKGEGTAREVQVILSGNRNLIGYLGDRKSLGSIQPGEKRTAEFKALFPFQLQQETADLKIEVVEGRGFSAAEAKTLKIAMKPGKAAAVKETVEVISQLPQLVFSTQLKDQNGNRILESGEAIELRITIENKGDGPARDVQVLLSGSPSLVGYFGERQIVGDIAAGERKAAIFKTVLPERISTETASLRISVREGKGHSPSESRTLKVAMRAVEVKETVELISEVNVDDIPLKVKGYERKDNVALIIGISKYREKTIPEVKFAARDAEVMARYLENVGGIPRSNIKVLTNDKATKSDLEAHINDWIGRRVNGNSTVFVYYAGHGAPGPQGNEAFIVPYEGHPDFPSQLYPLPKMYEALNKLPAREVVVMLDSCFSGAKGRSITGEGTRPLVMSIENPVLTSGRLAVLAASSGGQMSSDYEKARHGLFTYYLLRGMRGEASQSSEGTVELGSLYQFVKKNVAETASLELNRDQTPILLPADQTIKDKLKLQVSRSR